MTLTELGQPEHSLAPFQATACTERAATALARPATPFLAYPSPRPASCEPPRKEGPPWASS
jgi:hypothetical protein